MTPPSRRTPSACAHHSDSPEARGTLISCDIVQEPVGVWITHEHLHPQGAALAQYPAAPVCLIESRWWCTSRPWHWHKLVLVLSAMRHFTLELRAAGRVVDHVPLDEHRLPDTLNAGDLLRGLRAFVERHRLRRLVTLWPNNHDDVHLHASLSGRLGVPIDHLDNNLFYATPSEFARWASQPVRSATAAQAAGRARSRVTSSTPGAAADLRSPGSESDGLFGRPPTKKLVMEFWYRHIRQERGILLDGAGEPLGGQWNFDHDNRSVPRQATFPPAVTFTPDGVTREVEALVRRSLMSPVQTTHGNEPGSFGNPAEPGCFGNPAAPFIWPVTRRDALAALQRFLEERFADFGPFEDAMHSASWQMWHSALSPAMNIGLLSPQEIVQAAISHGLSRQVPINSIEGFVRQIVGWREYIRGMYWLHMPTYRGLNVLGAQRPLPAFYWSGETDMACLRCSVGSVRDRGYSHHIQRLMVLSNFAMLAGVSPAEVADWFIFAYVDGDEWVVLPNTIGMSLHADGGLVATKPYAASANYIGKMSNYCGVCRYDPKQRTGDSACPFNRLYWTFLHRHRDRFGKNMRMKMSMLGLGKLSPEDLARMQREADAFLDSLGVPSTS